MIKRILLFLLAIVVGLVAVLLLNTVRFRSQQKDFALAAPIEISDSVVDRLAQAVRIRTISYDDTTQIDYRQFDSLHTFLRRTYPLIDSLLVRQNINRYSLLYRWQGADTTLAPVVFTGHQDVVPAEEATLAQWRQAPFAGVVLNDTIWGRGTLDDKGSILALFEATSLLLRQGFRPQRTIYFAFGHDEEVSGHQGAHKLADHLSTLGIRPEMVMDEGLMITKGVVPGIEKPVAMIGTSQKGYLTLELKAQIPGGHSSMPAHETAIDVLGAALARLKAKPFEYELNPAVADFAQVVGPEMSFGLRMVFANRWLLEGAILNAYAATAPGRALISNTIAPTVFASGQKENAIPGVATALVNFRLAPGTSIEQVMAYVRKAVDDNRIEVSMRGEGYEASPVASTQTFGYQAIEKSVRETSPEVVVAPNLMIATADARFYEPVSENVYRFLPVLLHDHELGRIHGTNECIDIPNYKQSIRYYYHILLNSSLPKP